MRVKQLWERLRLPPRIILVWDRLTATRLTIAYFIFSLLHFLTQISFQSKAFVINQEAAGFLYDVIEQGNATITGFEVFGDDLRICDQAPVDFSTTSCRVVWNGTARQNAVAAPSAPSSVNTLAAPPRTSALQNPVSSPIPSLSVSPTGDSSLPTASYLSLASPSLLGDEEDVEPSDLVPLGSGTHDLKQRWSLLDEEENEHWQILSLDEDGHVIVRLNGMGYANTGAELDSSCLWALNWPVSVLANTKREDIVFIAFQFWLFGISLVALLNESIPHIIAALVAHLLASIWAVFQITHTAHFRKDFNRLITNGACNGVQLLPNYWQERATFEFIALGFNLLFLLLSAFFTHRLFKLFGWQTFKRIGASLVMNRLYKIVLSLSIVIQVSLFFMAVTTGLWIDQLYNGAIGRLATLHTLYQVMFIVTLVLLVPWIVTGWFSVRREHRLGMFAFLTITTWYIAGVNSMFFATTFRWTFIEWRFFSVMVVASIALAVTVFVLGLVARCNFGRGLPMYFNGHQPLPDNFVSVKSDDIEKFNFPSEQPIPTFSTVFDNSTTYIPPPEWNMGPPSQIIKPGDGLSKVAPVPATSTQQLPPPRMALIKPRPASDESHGATGVTVQRYNKSSTDGSYYHYRSDSQTSSTSSSSMGSRLAREGNLPGKRWVIE